MSPEPTEDRPAPSKGSEISNRMVSLLKEHVGRGPTEARTTMGRDLVVCVLEHGLTRGEKTLVERGEEGAVLDGRRAFKRAIQEEACAAVEDITGRTVIAFLSDNHLDPDISIEAFVLGGHAADAPAQGPLETSVGLPT
jgi:uncharacterized protein YbcI